MEVDILKNIINISTDKKSTLLYFLKKNVRDKVQDYNLLKKDEFYLRDTILCIRKDTLELEYTRRISYIGDDNIGIQINNKFTIYINPDEYYIFLKPSNRKNNRKFLSFTKKFRLRKSIHAKCTNTEMTHSASEVRHRVLEKNNLFTSTFLLSSSDNLLLL